MGVLSEDGEGGMRRAMGDRINKIKMHQKPYGFVFCLSTENVIEMCLKYDTVHRWAMPCPEVICH